MKRPDRVRRLRDPPEAACPRTGAGAKTVLWRAPTPRRSDASLRAASGLAADAEFLDQRPVAALVLALEIVEERAALRHELQETATRVVILHVRLEMPGQVVDALGQDGDLPLGRAGVAGLLREFLQERGLALGRNRHRGSFLMWRFQGRPPRLRPTARAAGPGCRPARSVRASRGTFWSAHEAPYSMRPKRPEPIAGRAGQSHMA